MEQLKKIWVYHFWILVGLVALLPVVGYFVNTRGLANEAATREAKLKNLKQELEKLKNGETPNDDYAKGVREREKLLKDEVDGAWATLYQRQAQFQTWPEGLKDIFEAALATKEDPGLPRRHDYQAAYYKQYQDLLTAVRGSAAHGTVFIDAGLLPIRTDWIELGALPPSVPEAALAQENLWITRAMLDVVKRANEQAAREDPPAVAVTQVRALAIGSSAVDDSSKKESMYDSDLTAPAAGARTTTTAAASKQAGRYIGTKNELFKQIPMYMQLIVNQHEVVNVMAQFADSGIPMEIKEIWFYELAAAQQNQDGAANLTRDDETFHQSVIQVWARAFLYEPPPHLRTQPAATASLSP